LTDLMHVSRARCSALLFSAVLIFGSAALFSPAAAQAPAVSTGVQQGLAPTPAAPIAPPAQRGGIVNRIVVQGNERIEESTILSYLTVQPGMTVT
jgi:outer membrane protein insertion porin family